MNQLNSSHILGLKRHSFHSNKTTNPHCVSKSPLSQTPSSMIFPKNFYLPFFLENDTTTYWDRTKTDRLPQTYTRTPHHLFFGKFLSVLTIVALRTTPSYLLFFSASSIPILPTEEPSATQPERRQDTSNFFQGTRRRRLPTYPPSLLPLCD